ncbi:MAG: hypothetical protein JNL74_19965 [Fibrobacteres bacterium]|nr:hypothetical protein [Fibrobacterota bacterium]
MMLRIVTALLIVLFSIHAFGTGALLTLNYPDEGSYIDPIDFMVAVSINDSLETPITAGDIEQGFKLTVNGVSVTNGLTFTDGVALFRPDDPSVFVKSGPCRIAATYSHASLSAEASWGLSILYPEDAVKDMEAGKSKLKQNGRVFTTFTHNTLAGDARYDIAGGAAYRLSYGKWRTTADLYLTNEESDKSQPRNVYTLGIAYSKNFELRLGDVAPSFNRLAINGQRLRGLELNTALYSKRGNKFLSLDAAYGEAVRSVNPYLRNQSDTAYAPGTFSRSLFCARLASGAGEYFQLGLMLVKGRDDTGSIHRNINDKADSSVSFSTDRPKDNVIIGADISSSFLRERVTLFGSYLLSLYSRDITHGSLTKAELESAMGPEELSIDPESFGKYLMFNTSTTPIYLGEGIMNSAALEGGMRVNLYGNTFSQYLEVKYVDIGPNYYSMAAPLLGSSKTGFSINERLTLMNSCISVNGNFENYTNGAGSALVKTDENSFGFSLSLMHSQSLPTLSLGYQGSGVKNSDERFGFDNSVGMFNASSRYTLNTKRGQTHNFQLYTALTGITNGWNSIIFEQDTAGTGYHVSDSTRDTSLSVKTQIYSLAWSTDIPDNPLKFNGSLMINSGSREFVKLFSLNGGTTFALLPEKLTLSGNVSYSSLLRPFDSDSKNQFRFRYGAFYRPHTLHTVRFEGSALAGTGKPDFRNSLHYEFRF